MILKNGSKGDGVRQLQEMLNGQGYGLDVDGIYGRQTAGAVQDYQQKNGLQVDGIVGDQTWGHLTSAMQNAANMANPDQTTAETAPAMSASQSALSGIEGSRPSFQQSQTLTDMLNQLQGRLNQQTGTYQSPYQAQIEKLYEQATTARKPFSYDPSADPIYRMYRARYTQSAKQAMKDTMAEAASLTGGYGNSYAQAAAQQAYDQRMQGLNDALPELYDQAYQRYQAEGDELLRQLALAQQMDQTAYGRYQDQLNDYYNRLDAERALANDMYNREYGEYADALNAYMNDRNYYYQKTQDELAQDNYLTQLAMAGSSGGGSSGGGGGGSSGSRKSSGGSGGSGTSTTMGKNYKSILSTAQGLRKSEQYNYVKRMADAGYLTYDEAMMMLERDLAIDVAAQATPTQSTVTTPLAPLAKNVTLQTATTPVSSALSSAVKTAQDVLSRAITGVTGNYNKIAGNTTTKSTATTKNTTMPYSGMLTQAALEKLKKK